MLYGLKRNILHIDDNADDQVLFAEAIKRIDPLITCWFAFNVQGAVKVMADIRRLRPVTIFLDLHMPGMHGKEFLKILRSSEIYADVPIVIYTSSESEQDKRETKQLGANYFLTKPHSIHDMKRALSSVLDRIQASAPVSKTEQQQRRMTSGS